MENFQIPKGSSTKEAQAIVDNILLHGATIKMKSNRYDGHKFEDLFADGEAVFNRLIGNARMLFIRFVRIKDELIPQLMDEAAGYQLDQNSHLYDLVYSRVKGWRKNWGALYIKAADAIQSEIEEANPFIMDLPIDGLKSTYASKYSWALIH